MNDNTRRALWRCGALALLAGTAFASSPALAATTTIVAQHSNKCLDVRGGPTATADGALIEQWSCSGQANQAWTLTDKGQGRYQLVASSSGKCVEVINGATGNGAGIQQATCSDLTRQLWNIQSKGGGLYEIIAVSGGRCLDVTGGPTATGDGVLTELWDCTGQANQAWALTLPTTSPPAVEAKPLVAKHSNKCLNVRGGTAATGNGALVEQWTCTGQANQAWSLTSAGNGLYQLIARHSGKCLDTVNGGTSNETRLQQSDCTGQPRQLWAMQSMGAANEYRFVHQASGRCLDVIGGPSATGDGVLTELWDCTGQANQTWSIGATGGGGGMGTPGPYGQDASQYTLVFSDEFDGTSLDSSKWSDTWGGYGSDPTYNYAVSNGSLKMWPEPGTNLHRNYRHITSDTKYYQTYGFFEIEAKLPYGRGPWPAFWLYNRDAEAYGGDARPEIDIMEAYPGGGPDSGWSGADLHATTYAPTVWRKDGDLAGTWMYETPYDLSTSYHKYAVKWEPGRQTFYFDGQPIYTLNVSFPDRMFIVLSFQFGSASGQADASTPLGQSNSFDIRYVRAWQFKTAQAP